MAFFSLLILIEICDFRYNYHGRVNMSLKTLSVNNNSAKHKEANIEWLESKLQKAKDIDNQVWKWISKCNML
jgi:hypothetical protein